MPSVAEYLSYDHRRLAGLLREAVAVAEGGSPQEASGRFEEFRTGLERHIQMEEQVLFPFFEQASGIVEGGPTLVMRQDHRRIQAGLREATLALEQADPAGFLALVAALAGVLEQHNLREERILYPSTNGACAHDERREELVRRLMAV